MTIHILLVSLALIGYKLKENGRTQVCLSSAFFACSSFLCVPVALTIPTRIALHTPQPSLRCQSIRDLICTPHSPLLTPPLHSTSVTSLATSDHWSLSVRLVSSRPTRSNRIRLTEPTRACHPTLTNMNFGHNTHAHCTHCTPRVCPARSDARATAGPSVHRHCRLIR